MRKPIKIVAVAATSILILIGTTFYVIEKNRAVTDPITIVETDGTIYEIDVISDAKSISDGIDCYMETVGKPISMETVIPTNPINTEVVRVIEEDSENGSITIENAESNIVVTNDEALAIAEANSEAEDILNDVLADIILVESGSNDKVYKADVKDVKSKEEIKEAYSPETVIASSKKSDNVEKDQVTIDLFNEMGWRMDASKDAGVDTSEGRVVPYEGKGNPFYTP